MQGHEQLLVWQKAVDLAVAVYSVTEKFPARESFGLTSQMRRAAVSIPSNIAEGRRRGTDRDFLNFLRIAHGSLAELDTQCLIASRTALCSKEDYKRIYAMTAEVGKMLHGMIKKL